MSERPEGLSVEIAVATLGLEPLADEGGLWAQSWRDEFSSAIYFLLQPDDFSALHRLAHTELWHFYAGAPVTLLLLDDSVSDSTLGTGSSGRIAQPTLGQDLLAGQRPCVPVSAGTWMGAATTGDWSLVGTTVAPPYEPSVFELGSATLLAELFPEAEDAIAAFTRAAQDR